MKQLFLLQRIGMLCIGLLFLAQNTQATQRTYVCPQEHKVVLQHWIQEHGIEYMQASFVYELIIKYLKVYYAKQSKLMHSCPKDHATVLSQWVRKNKHVVPHAIQHLIIDYLSILYKEILIRNELYFTSKRRFPPNSSSQKPPNHLSQNNLLAYFDGLVTYTYDNLLIFNPITGLCHVEPYPKRFPWILFDDVISAGEHLVFVSRGMTLVYKVPTILGGQWGKRQLIPHILSWYAINLDPQGRFIIGFRNNKKKEKQEIIKFDLKKRDSQVLVTLPIGSYIKGQHMELSSRYNKVFFISTSMSHYHSLIYYVDIKQKKCERLAYHVPENYHALTIKDTLLIASFFDASSSKQSLRVCTLDATGQGVRSMITIPTNHTEPIDSLMMDDQHQYLLSSSSADTYLWRIDGKGKKLICVQDLTQEAKGGKQAIFFTTLGLLFLLINGYILNLGKVASSLKPALKPPSTFGKIKTKFFSLFSSN